MYDKQRVIEEFHDALVAAGLILTTPPIMNGALHRVPVSGERPGRMGGAYVGFLDGWPAGHICNWRTGFSENWKASHAASGGSRPMQPSATRAQSQKDRAKQTERLQLRAARYADSLWTASGPARSHPYLEQKRVAAHGLRVSKLNRLLVPMHDAEGRLWSVQAINEQGEKQFLFGARMLGCFHVIGDINQAGTVAIAEGYATAATLYESLGIAVLVAFNAANLLAVAIAAQAQWPDHRIVIAGDDDGDDRCDDAGRPIRNTGKLKAMAAAEAIGALCLLPEFDTAHAGATDWNDLARLAGPEKIRRQWSPVLDPLVPEVPRRA